MSAVLEEPQDLQVCEEHERVSTLSDAVKLATASALEAMTQCAPNEEGVAHDAQGQRAVRTGLVQSHGSVLMVSSGPELCGAPWGTVLAVSENSLEVLGVAPGDLLDRDLFDADVSPFEGNMLESLRRALTVRNGDNAPTNDEDPPTVHGSLKRKGGFIAHIVVNRTEEGFVINVEPNRLKSVSSAVQGQLLTNEIARGAAARVQSVCGASVQEQCHALVREVAALTAYDRVMIMKIHAEDHGEVIAEFVKEGVSNGRWIGLRFPASNMPQENEGTVLTRMRTRMIADISKSSATIMQSDRLGENINLSGSPLRGIDGTQRQHLRNMGVTATMNVALIVTGVRGPSLDYGHGADITFTTAGKRGAAPAATHRPSTPWGLLVCQDYVGSRFVRHDQRIAVEFLASIFATQLGRKLDADAQASLERTSRAQLQVVEALRTTTGFNISVAEDLAAVLMPIRGSSNLMLEVAEATGCAMRLGGKWYMVGACPDAAHLTSLAQWMKDAEKLESGGCYGTISLLRSGFPEAEATTSTMAGVLAVDLEGATSGTSSTSSANGPAPTPGVVLWMRGLANEENVALNRERTVSIGAAVEEVSPECAPWSAFAMESAQGVQEVLHDTIRLRREGLFPSKTLMALYNERMHDKSELCKATDELRAAICAASMPVVRLDPDLNIVNCNDSARKLSGAVADVLGMPFVSLLEEACKKKAEEELRRAVEDQSNRSPGCVQVVFSASAPGSPPEGRPVTLFTHMNRNASGKAESITLICHDMSAKRRIRRSSTDTAEPPLGDCRDFIKSCPSPIFCIGPEGEVTEWSKAMEELTGLDGLSVLGKNAVGAVFGRNGLLMIAMNTKRDEFATEKLLALLASARQGGRPDPNGEYSVIFSFLRNDNGMQVEVQVTSRPRLGPDEEPFGAFVFVKDLTTANALEKAVAVKLASEAVLESKKRHTAFLCHEIQQPVNGILTTMEAMQEAMTSNASNRADSTEIVELLSITTSCMDQLRLTIDCALDSKDIEVNHLKVQPAPFKPMRTLRAVMSQIVKTAHEKGLSVECNVNDPDLRAVTLLGDTLRIQQILTNFCWNSVKFTSKGTITISMTWETHSDTKPGWKHLIFKVADTGIGIDEETQKRLFQKPGLIGSTSSSSGKLGLDICRKLAMLMGGEVRCRSVYGIGTTFSLEITLEIAKNSPTLSPFTSGEFRLPEQPQPQTTPLLSPGVEDLHIPRAPRNSFDTSFTAANSAAPYGMQQQSLPPHPPHAATCPPAHLPPLAAAAGFSGNPSPSAPTQQQFENYMMANPWANGSQVYQRPYYGGFMQQAPPNLTDAKVRVVREMVHGTHAAVLIEAQAPGGVWQQWGSATVVNGNTSAAIMAATNDATLRIGICLQNQRPPGVPMMPGYQYAPMAAYPTPQPQAAAAGFHPGAVEPMQQSSQYPGTQSAPSTSPAPLATPSDAKPTPPSTAPDAKPTGSRDLQRSKSLSSEQTEKREESPSRRALTKVKSADGASTKAPVDPRTALPSRIKVLVVDGDLEHLKAVQEALKCSSTSCKFEVTVAEDGQDVIKLGIAQGIRYDVMLLGERMKQMNGSDAASVYRRYEAANRLPGTLMIVSSNKPSPLKQVFYQSCGIDGTLQKSAETQNLARDIVTCFGWRLENQLHKPLGPAGCRKGKLLAEATDAKNSVCIKDTKVFESSLFFGDGNLEVFGRSGD